MIKNSISLSMSEALEFVKGSKDEGKEVKAFIKKFIELNEKDAKELRKELQKLGLMRLDERTISKIIDIMPENNEDLSKIFSGFGLDEDESKKVIEVVMGFK